MQRQIYWGYVATRKIRTALGNFEPGEAHSTVGVQVDTKTTAENLPPRFDKQMGLVSVGSFVSEEHAVKVALKAYDWFLKHPENFDLS